ncbi:hypothetical protein TELCIR_07720 [Teladorsagia circumcincta]|uniref:C-type lectin domain-containing protein n=1 Tax=Teladorsagia circumcincta TaxID=45464 RepID=A0A2G9UJJ2_TELCI|nr:hypothetical protein TELCIR_07720 [Teladorsagia circumcincta]
MAQVCKDMKMSGDNCADYEYTIPSCIAFPPNTKLWLGLQYKGDQWTWPGGYSAGFTNWAPGQPNYHAGNCAYMQLYPGSKSAWFTDDCYSDHYYMCQAKPCDSTKYCPAE